MKINIISSGSSTKPLRKSGEFILQNIDSLPKNILVSGKLLCPAKSTCKNNLKEDEFFFDKSKKMIIFKISNIYEELNVNIINETNKN
jgi:hypothetical protein